MIGNAGVGRQEGQSRINRRTLLPPAAPEQEEKFPPRLRFDPAETALQFLRGTCRGRRTEDLSFPCTQRMFDDSLMAVRRRKTASRPDGTIRKNHPIRRGGGMVRRGFPGIEIPPFHHSFNPQILTAFRTIHPDRPDKRSGKLFMLCKIQDLMRRIVKIRQNHPPELFFPFIHLSSSGELTADFDCFENAPGGDVSTTQPGARLEGSLLLYPGRNAGTTFRTSGGHPDMNPVRRESDSINSPPSRGKE